MKPKNAPQKVCKYSNSCLWESVLETELNVELDKSRRFPKMTIKCLGIGTPKTLNFPFVQNGKLMVLGVPIFKHFRVLAL